MSTIEAEFQIKKISPVKSLVKEEEELMYVLGASQKKAGTNRHGEPVGGDPAGSLTLKSMSANILSALGDIKVGDWLKITVETM